LRHLLDHVDWPIRLAFTRQLGALGDPVPTVTRVVVSIQTNGTHLITLIGTHFAPHVELIIDGRPVGVVSQSTSDQLVAVISNSAWSAGEHDFGVRNPDGTAAQMSLDGDDHELNQPGSEHSRIGTPVPKGDSDD
jgi:IPT/TIG domain